METLNHQSNRTLCRSCSELESQPLERTATLQSLSQRLLRVQDEERRRVARDLHDSTGQTFTALKISVALLRQKLQADQQVQADLSTIDWRKPLFLKGNGGSRVKRCPD